MKLNWNEPKAKPERPWKCHKCGIGLSYVSATRAKEHERKCDREGDPNPPTISAAAAEIQERVDIIERLAEKAERHDK